MPGVTQEHLLSLPAAGATVFSGGPVPFRALRRSARRLLQLQDLDGTTPTLLFPAADASQANL